MSEALRDYGMVFVLLLLCVFFSLVTLERQPAEGPAAAGRVVRDVQAAADPDATVLVVSSQQPAALVTAELIASKLAKAGFQDVHQTAGAPSEIRSALDRLRNAGQRPAVVCGAGDAMTWPLWTAYAEQHPGFAEMVLIAPSESLRSTFLKPSNLLAIVDRIVVIAVIAVGMTMVIISGGIDLSVGSLIALSAVIATTVMKSMGGLDAPAPVVLIGFLAGMFCCGVSGAVAGSVVAYWRVAPFIVTLAIMMIARGLSFQITGGFSIYQVPSALTWLGQGHTIGIPNTVLLLIALYVAAHVFMTRFTFGRYIYALGGNEESARLSGVPVRAVTIFVYAVCGLMAGLGGCIQASQLNTGTPNSGLMYELYVIAAVVVGGTSLSGGTGRILGTLIGAFIISVIQNGMNLTGLESYTQQVVLGLIILGAVLLDRLRGRATFGRLRQPR